MFLFVMSVFIISQARGYGAFLFIPAAAVLGIVAGICLHPFMSAPLANAFGAIFYPKGRGELPEQFTSAHALMAQQEYGEAAHQLRGMLAERPELVDGHALLASLLYEHLDQAGEALAVARAALTSADWHPAHERLTMLATDILLEQGATVQALELLQRSLRRAGKTAAATAIAGRLKSVRNGPDAV